MFSYYTNYVHLSHFYIALETSFSTLDILQDDNEGDGDNAHEFHVVGKKGQSNAAHNKWRCYHVS